MSAKVCPRCGSLFQSLKSATCPQCFAILDTIDDQTAQELAAEKTNEESSDEFQAARKQDNEQWAEQSFKACLGVAAITFLTVVVSIVILVIAVRHSRHNAALRSGPAAVIQPTVLTKGPSTAALPNEILPSTAGLYVRTALESDIALPGVTDSIIHGTYNLPDSGKDADVPAASGHTFDVFVIRQTSLETNGDAFKLGCAMAAHVGASSFSVRPIFQGASGPNWTYAVIGDNEPDGAAKAQTLLGILTSGARASE